MRILLSNDWYYPDMRGGAEQSVKLLSETLASRGHQVSVLCARSCDQEEPYEIINGVTVIRKSPAFYEGDSLPSKILAKCLCVDNPAADSYLSEVIGKVSPDILHTNTTNNHSLRIWKVARRSGARIVHTLRDYGLWSPRGLLEEVNPVSAYGLFHGWYWRKCRKLSEIVDGVTAPSSFTLQAMVGKGFFPNAQRRRIVNAVPGSCDEPRQRLSTLRDPDVFSFLYMGRLIPVKGIDRLLRVFSSLDGENLRLTVCGDGPLAVDVQEACIKDSRIEYKGHLKNEDLRLVMHNSDAVIVPSEWDEPFGRVVVEANSAGLPVIATARGGLGEVMRDIGGGLLVADGDDSVLRDAMVRFSRRTCFDEYQTSIERSLPLYSSEVQAAAFEEFYDSVLSC